MPMPRGPACTEPREALCHRPPEGREMNDLRTTIAARLSVRTKLLGLSALLILMMSVTGGLAIVNLSAVNDKADYSYAQSTIALEHLATLESTLIDKARLVIYGVLIGKNSDS